MKTVLTKFLAIGSASLLLLASCKKQGVEVMSNGGKPGALTANTTTLPLNKAMVNDTTKVIVFNFTKANYGFAAAVTNTLQIDAQGDNWANPTSFTLGNGVYSQGFSTFDFNNLVLKLNLAAGVASQVNVRIAHVLAPNVPAVYSNTLSLTVTPFNLTSWVYLPGAYEGWANPGPQEDSLVSVTGNGVYTGIINFTGASSQFLIVPVKGSWANKWATTDAATGNATSVTYSTEYVTGGGNNFQTPTTPGYYLLTFNSNTNQFSIQQADYYSIIGSATPGGNWSTDLFLKFINDGNNNWTGTFTLLGGQFKFRQDAAWSNSWGDIATPDGKDATDSNGGNINVTAGTHTVTFNMAPSVLGATPPVTTTYSLQ